MRLPLGSHDDGPERLWFDDDVTAIGDRRADFAAGLVSLGFIRAALRRSARFWSVAAVVGLLVGFGLYVAAPPTHQASTTLLLTVGPESVPGTAILDDQAIAHSRSVAGLALHKLGLRQSVGSFLGSYIATVVTDRVLLITVSAPSSSEAVSRANALATAFLKFRADQQQALQGLEFSVLDQRITQAKQHIKSISDQIGQLAAQPASSSQQAKLTALRAQRDSANSDLTALEQATSANQATTQVATASMVGESKVLDGASPLAPKSRFKRLILYAAAGFIIGLILGVSIVVVRALVSDRLLRRDDVAHALGAPVKLSVPARRVSRWFPGRRGLEAARSPTVRRIVAHLGNAVPPSSGGPASLAVVPVDDVQMPAVCLVSLAVACAQQGMQVVVADLCRGAPAARLLGAKDPGVHTVSVDGAHLVTAVPEPDDVVPVGPLLGGSLQTRATESLAAACASADLLLTLVPLDPSAGSEHLATWAADAVVVLTAGQSSWTKIHAVGEMIRLAGTRLVSAVLVGADKTDESLGVTHPPGAGRSAIAKEGLRSDGDGSFVTADGGSGGRRPTGDPPRRIRVSGVPRP